VSYRTEIISYQKIRIVCDRCGAKARCGPRGWATSTVGADSRAEYAGWYVAPLTSYSDLVAGGPHYCPSCAESTGDLHTEGAAEGEK